MKPLRCLDGEIRGDRGGERERGGNGGKWERTRRVKKMSDCDGVGLFER